MNWRSRTSAMLSLGNVSWAFKILKNNSWYDWGRYQDVLRSQESKNLQVDIARIIRILYSEMVKQPGIVNY